MSGKKILIVEDEALVALDLTDSLEAWGYTVTAACSTGGSAVASARENPPDLVLMDISLYGEMDGIEAAKSIQAFLDVPVIFTTAYCEDDVLDRAKMVAPYGYLGKPFHTFELRNTLETALYKHEADKKVRESEERYRRLVKLMPDGVIVHINGELVLVNEEFARICGRDRPEDLIGRLLTECVHPDEHETVERRRRALAAGETVPRIEGRVVKPDGVIAYVEAQATPIEYEGKPAALTVVRDITARKETERALRESEERFRGVFENAAVGIDMVDRSGYFTMVNAAFSRMLGYAPDEVTKRTFVDLTHPEDRFKSRDQYEALLAGRIHSYRLEKRYIKKDGGVLWADVAVSPVRNSEGTYVATMGVISDITERKEAEEELKKARSSVGAGA